MDDLFPRATTPSDVFLTADARAAGYGPRAIARQVRSGEWHPLRRGAYTTRETWQAADATARHILLAQAVQLQALEPIALTHLTGAIALGLETWRPDLATVHVTSLGGQSGRIEYGVNRHEGPLAPEECARVNGLLVGPPAHVIAGAMLLSSHDQAMVLGDSALNRGVTTAAALSEIANGWWNVPGSRALRWTIPRLDGRAANGGETLARGCLRRANLTPSELQYEIRDGSFVAYSDFAWPEHRVLGEFDGKRKYQRDLRPREDPGEAVFREKVREDRLRSLGWVVVRIIWADLFAFAPVAERFRRALRGSLVA